MSTPIHFMGREYASMEEMPPQIRQAYEQLRDAIANKYPGKDVDEVLAEAMNQAVMLGEGGMQVSPRPAWGGQASSPMVPNGFESFVELGPVVKGYMARGDVIVWRKSKALQALVLYRDGFAYRRGNAIDTCTWSEVASIVSREEVDSNRDHSWIAYLFTLLKKNGESVKLEVDELEEICEIIAFIKQNAYAVLLPPLEDQYKSGQPVNFGAVTISQQNGIQANGKRFAWNSIFNVKVQKGRLIITTQENKSVSVRASSIPNIEILCQIIGVDLASIDLAYN
jgi:hypothetical protein